MGITGNQSLREARKLADNSLKVSDASERSIRELSRDLKNTAPEMILKLKASLKDIAESIAADTRSKVPRRTGRAASSIKARSTASSASIAFGGSIAPYYFWLDFGGSTGRGHIDKTADSGAIHREWMGKPDGEGRYLYPTIREHIPDTTKRLGDVIDGVMKEADIK